MKSDIKHSIIITLDRYAGNHEQEIAAWLFNSSDHHRGERQVPLYEAWVKENDPYELMEYVTENRSYEEYGYTTVGLDPFNTNALEIYIDTYALADDVIEETEIIRGEMFKELVLKRIGDGNIGLIDWKDEKYTVKVLKVELREITTSYENESWFNAKV